MRAEISSRFRSFFEPSSTAMEKFSLYIFPQNDAENS